MTALTTFGQLLAEDAPASRIHVIYGAARKACLQELKRRGTDLRGVVYVTKELGTELSRQCVAHELQAALNVSARPILVFFEVGASATTPTGVSDLLRFAAGILPRGSPGGKREPAPVFFKVCILVPPAETLPSSFMDTASLYHLCPADFVAVCCGMAEETAWKEISPTSPLSIQPSGRRSGVTSRAMDPHVPPAEESGLGLLHSDSTEYLGSDKGRIGLQIDFMPIISEEGLASDDAGGRMDVTTALRRLSCASPGASAKEAGQVMWPSISSPGSATAEVELVGKVADALLPPDAVGEEWVVEEDIRGDAHSPVYTAPHATVDTMSLDDVPDWKSDALKGRTQVAESGDEERTHKRKNGRGRSSDSRKKGGVSTQPKVPEDSAEDDETVGQRIAKSRKGGSNVRHDSGSKKGTKAATPSRSKEPAAVVKNTRIVDTTSESENEG